MVARLNLSVEAEYAGEVEHVRHYIWTLRSKIEVDPGDPKHILTERGFGYRFEIGTCPMARQTFENK
jgi:DNA-binding response OmpR family regulator